jgi:ribonuclease HII
MSLADFDVNFLNAASELVGVDEAGRGPLAGPVTACACHIPKNLYGHPLMSQINDSKKLPRKKRSQIARELKTLPIVFALGFASSSEIDKINILRATFLAMRRALLKFEKRNIFILVDGNKTIPDLNHKQKAVVGGDGKSLCVAAASILAKTARDGFMEILHKQYIQYGFAAHKGYGCKAHIDALGVYGPCEQHRMTFEPIASMRGGLFKEWK